MKNRVKTLRIARGWSQDDLARRSNLSRSGISAIEIDRLVPSAEAALAIARAFGCRFEEVFYFEGADEQEVVWAASPGKTPCRYWEATVSGRRVLYPSVSLVETVIPHDGVFDGAAYTPSATHATSDPERVTLVIASCDPAVGLLASELARTRQMRLPVLPLSSRAALDALGKGLVHAAGIHFAGPGEAGNDALVRSQLGDDYHLVSVATWESGLVFPATEKIASVRAALNGKLRWVGREAGSGARQCLDELFGERTPPKHVARSHRGVAEAIRSGYADAGVCVELVGEQAGLDFLGVRQEPYDLCFAAADARDGRIRALVEVIQSAAYRRLLGDLPGYTVTGSGEVRTTG